MKKHYFKTTYALVISAVFLILTACNGSGQKIEYYQIIFEFDESLKDINADEALPNQLTALMDYYEPTENEECFGVIYVPEIEYKRTDINESVKFGTPLTSISSIQKSTKTLSTINLKEGYDTSLLTVPKLLVKGDKEKKTTNSKKELVLNINDDNETIESLKTKIHNLLCSKKATSITIVVKQNNHDSIITGEEEESTKSGEGGDPTVPVTSPCSENTLASALDLREEMLKAINSNLSLSQRNELALEVWNKYFDKNAYVAIYQHKEDNNPEVWNPGEGKNYFTHRLSILESITDINIFRVETSQKSGKISGIKIIECHNATEAL